MSSSIPAIGELSNNAAAAAAASSPADVDATRQYLEQVRLAILGMEQRLQAREDKLAKHVERAEAEGARFEEVRRQAQALASSAN